MTKRNKYTIKVDTELRDEFRNLLEAQGVTASRVIEELIRQYIAYHRPQPDAKDSTK